MIRSTRLAPAIAAALIAGVSSWGSSLWSGPLLWAAFVGWASTFAFSTFAPDATTTSRLTEISWTNGALAAGVSLLIGTGVGVLHGLFGHHLAARSPASAPVPDTSRRHAYAVPV